MITKYNVQLCYLMKINAILVFMMLNNFSNRDLDLPKYRNSRTCEEGY